MKSPVVFVVLIGVALGQYGPPKQTGPKKHRTTTTEPPNAANEIQPTVFEESGVLPDGGNYHIKASSINQPGLSVMAHSYSISGPNQPQGPYGNQQPCGFGGACSPQSQQPIDISKNPFINAALTGVPVTSKPSNGPQPQPGQPQPGQPQNKPSSNPFLPPNLPQQPQPGYPSPSQPPYQPQKPNPGYPNQQPQPGSPNPPHSGQQALPFPNQPGQAQPGYPHQQPQPGYPQQPSQPTPNQPLKPQPGYPNQQPQGQQPTPFPNQPGQPQPGYPHQPQPGSPNQPQTGQQPLPFPSQPGQAQPGYPHQQPQPGRPQPGYPNQQPQQPQPQQPLPSPNQPNQPQPGYPNQQPHQPQPQQPHQPQPQQPFPSPNQPNRPQPGYPSQQPQPQQPHFPQSGQQPLPFPNQPSQPQPGRPQVGYPNQQPQQPNIPQSGQQPLPFPNLPSQPQPGRPQPGYPNQQPQQPGQPQPVRPQPGYPNQQPQQPGQPQPVRPQPGYPNQQPQQPVQPQPARPQPGYPVPPNQGSSVLPTQQRPQPVNPTNPFLSGNVVPKNPICSGEHQFCVPQNACFNGLIADKSTQPESNYRKGQCNAGEVCCKAPNKPPSYGQPNPSYVTEGPQQKYTGPLNTTPPPGCAAALKCVQEIYCTVEGVMSDTPVALTREQTENKVPLTDCQDPDTGILGKCCRDPNYKDPWPAGMMMPNMNSGFDDGQYHPDKYPGENPTAIPQVIPHYNPQGLPKPNNPYLSQQATISPPNPHTIKKPLGAFNTVVTPFPVAPKPGQTHSQVFPQNEDKVFANVGVDRPSVSPGNPFIQNLPQQGPNTPGPSNTNPGGGHPIPSPGAPYTPPGQTSPYSPQGSFPGSQTTSQGPTGYQPQPQQPQPQQPQQPQPQQPPQSQPQQPQPQPQQPSQPHQFTPHHTSPPLEAPVKPGEECGVRRPVPPTKPDETGYGEFPWHVVILSAGNRSAICSGAIIAPNAVLTAAHCIEGIRPEDMVIKAGEWTLGHPTDKPIQMRVVAASAIHPVYSSGSLVKDQAVIVTEKPFNFDQHVDKICLPAPGSGTYTPSTTTCYLTGWGRPALQVNAPGSVLHKVPISIIPKDQCENSLKSTHLGKYFILNEGFTCAVPPSEADLCKVDIGSPLVCERPDGHYELAGVYSWDTKCSSSLPGIMATCDTDWVNQILQTPVETLKQQAIQKQSTHLPEDVDSKPGFALGYGK